MKRDAISKRIPKIPLALPDDPSTQESLVSLASHPVGQSLKQVLLMLVMRVK